MRVFVFFSRFFSIFLIALISKSSAMTLNCIFKDHNSYWGTKYACVAHNLTTSYENRTITAINGTHIEGKTNEDVLKVMIEHQNCHLLPINLGEHFKNLEILYAMKSHVSHLTKNDLDGLTKLKVFDVSYNPITTLLKDYFVGHETIEIVSFYSCSLVLIENGTLEALTNLKEGHFQYNKCVDFRGDNEMLLPTLIKKLEERCHLAPIQTIEWNDSDSVENFFYHPDEHLDYVDNSEDYELYDQKTTKRTTTSKPIVEIRYRKEYVCELSFTRRNANAIILLLITIIAALICFVLKSNGFARLI